MNTRNKRTIGICKRVNERNNSMMDRNKFTIERNKCTLERNKCTI